MSAQTTGLTLLAVAGTLLWSAWALAVAGALLIVVPEVAALVRRRRARAAYRAAVARGAAPAVLPS
ncbi:hypothetical protein TEK04_19525 [Klenkia sp. LSe6-5]|uniref:Uncharacterized protein n=1 Tax=Klenkia sesuvii TaxID=3103137 RepID=A0ABU8E0W5_9ACTN